MKTWVKHRLMRFFNLCERADLDRVWEKWSAAVAVEFQTLASMQNSLDILTRNNDQLTRTLSALQTSRVNMIMELSILRVGQTEYMERTLDMLLPLLNCKPEEQEPAIIRACDELYQGIELLKNQPSVKGVWHGQAKTSGNS